MTCGAVQQHGTTCSHCGRHMPADGRPRSTSSTHSQAPGGTPPRVSPLAAMSRAMASTPEADVSGAGAAAASLLQRGGMAAPGLDSINLANSPALDAALLEKPAAAEGSGSPRGTFDFTAGADMHLLTGHKGAILNLVQDCDGLLYSCSSDKTVKVCCGVCSACMPPVRGRVRRACGVRASAAAARFIGAALHVCGM